MGEESKSSVKSRENQKTQVVISKGKKKISKANFQAKKRLNKFLQRKHINEQIAEKQKQISENLKSTLPHFPFETEQPEERPMTIESSFLEAISSPKINNGGRVLTKFEQIFPEKQSPVPLEKAIGQFPNELQEQENLSQSELFQQRLGSEQNIGDNGRSSEFSDLSAPVLVSPLDAPSMNQSSGDFVGNIKPTNKIQELLGRFNTNPANKNLIYQPKKELARAVSLKKAASNSQDKGNSNSGVSSQSLALSGGNLPEEKREGSSEREIANNLSGKLTIEKRNRPEEERKAYSRLTSMPSENVTNEN